MMHPVLPVATPSLLPLRFQLNSLDKLCHISMQIEWVDECGDRQRWNSWDDALCSCYGATKYLPCRSRDISVSFSTQPGGQRVRRVDRRSKCKWVKGELEVIRLRISSKSAAIPAGEGDGSPLLSNVGHLPLGDDAAGVAASLVAVGWEDVDAWFEIAGPIGNCFVRRAWNARNSGLPASWEMWENFHARRSVLPPPSTIWMADKAAAWPVPIGTDNADHVAVAMVRLKASCAALRVARIGLLAFLKELEEKMTKQWYQVTSGNTLAAGMAIASITAILTVPPVGIALGVGSAAAGIGAAARDMVGDHSKGNAFARAVYDDMHEQMGLDSVEAELSRVLASVDLASRRSKNTNTHSQRVGGALVATTQTAALAVHAMRSTLRISRFAVLAGEGISIIGRTLGTVSAGLAVGVALHGLNTTKPSHKLVQEKIKEVERSVQYLCSFEERVGKALSCPLCGDLLGFGAFSRSVARCGQFHCFHRSCLLHCASDSPKNVVDADDYQMRCPSCDSAGEVLLKSVGAPSDRLGVLLHVLGLRRSSSLELLPPQLVDRGQHFANSLRARGASLQGRDLDELVAPKSFSGASIGASTKVDVKLVRGHSAEELPEEMETHEAWIEAVKSAGSVLDLPHSALVKLLCTGSGMPMKYRHELWLYWLGVPQRIDDAARQGFSYDSLADTRLPQHVHDQINADVPRSRAEFVPSSRYHELTRLLVALSAMDLHVGYAQGMNHLAAVLLKLGFQNEEAFWILVAILEDVIPKCHAPDRVGLFRDTAVTQVLLQALLPRHAKALEDLGIDLLWITANYFLALGTKNGPLALVVRMWDLFFLFGPRAVFAGLLVQLELFLPLDITPAKGSAAVPDAEDLMQLYRDAGLMARCDDAALLASKVLELLHSDRAGGLSDTLIMELRDSLEGLTDAAGKSLTNADADAASALISSKEPELMEESLF